MTRWKWISQVVTAAALCGVPLACAQTPRLSGYSAAIDSDTRAPAFGLQFIRPAEPGSFAVVGRAGSPRRDAVPGSGTTPVQPAELPQVPDALGPSPIARLQKPDPWDDMGGGSARPAAFAETVPAQRGSAADPRPSGPEPTRTVDGVAADASFNPTLPFWAQQPNLSALPGDNVTDAEGERRLEPIPTGFGAAPQFFDPQEIFHHDVHDFIPSLCRDTHEVLTWENGLGLLVAGGASLTIRATIDDDVSRDTARHPDRWGWGTDALATIGNPGVHLAATAALYGWSLHTQDDELHSLSGALFNALVLTDLSTLGLKLIADTDRPNGDRFGWPSGHTSSSVAVAAVLDEYYGHGVGVPAYVLAGLVAWARIDDRQHDLSDVVFGAALGYVIGKTVAREHHTELFGMQLTPYADYHGTPGVGLERRF